MLPQTMGSCRFRGVGKIHLVTAIFEGLVRQGRPKVDEVQRDPWFVGDEAIVLANEAVNPHEEHAGYLPHLDLTLIHLYAVEQRPNFLFKEFELQLCYMLLLQLYYPFSYKGCKALMFWQNMQHLFSTLKQYAICL